MGAFPGRGARALLALLALAVLAGPAAAARPRNGNGAYKLNDAYTNVANVHGFLGNLGVCVPRADGSWDFLVFRSQCGSFPTTAKAIPSLGGTDTIWNWVCYATLVSGPANVGNCRTGAPNVPAATAGLGRAYYNNWYTANQGRNAAFIAEIGLWTEADILRRAKRLFEALSDASKQFIIDALMASQISEYIQDSTFFNAFMWQPPNTPVDAVYIAKLWKTRALLVALRSRTPETAGNVVYRGRELRGTEPQQTATYTVGNVVWEKGYASSTQVEDQAYGYTRPTTANVEIVEITAAPNSRGHVLGTVLTREVLFEPGTRFTVTGFQCNNNVNHAFIACAFTTCAPTALCTPACQGTWNKVCRIQLQEVDPSTFCNNGADFEKVCVEPVTFTRSYWKSSKVLGKCDFEGSRLTAKPIKLTHGVASCQRASVCRTAAGDIEVHTKIVMNGNCNPTAGASAIYFTPPPGHKGVGYRRFQRSNSTRLLPRMGGKPAPEPFIDSGMGGTPASESVIDPEELEELIHGSLEPRAGGRSAATGRTRSGKKSKWENDASATLGRSFFPKNAGKILDAEEKLNEERQKTDDVDGDGVDDSMEDDGGGEGGGEGGEGGDDEAAAISGPSGAGQRLPSPSPVVAPRTSFNGSAEVGRDFSGAREEQLSSAGAAGSETVDDLRAQLAAARESEAAALAEVRRMEVALDRFVPHQFLELLGKQHIWDLSLGDAVEEKLTVLFLDIRNFTPLCESLSPQDTFRFVNSFFGALVPEIERHGGFVDKYIGDAIMALFPGTRGARAGGAADGIAGAVAVLRALDQYNEIRLSKGRKPVHVGIGLNTGTAVVGTVGGSRRMENTVLSDAVNLASRLESMTKRYGVPLLISEGTLYSLGIPPQQARFVDRIRVKGKRQPHSVYEIFEVDEPSVRSAKALTRSKFEEAVAWYHMKEIHKAVPLLEDVIAECPEDQPARVYLERCGAFLTDGTHEGTGELEGTVEWRDEFVLGVEEIDEQHHALVDAMNRLAPSLKAGDSDSVAAVLIFLDSYVRDHFSLEKGLMQRYRYPFTDEHMREHQSFVEHFKRLRYEIESGRHQHPFLVFLVQVFLIDWFANHSTQTDRHLTTHLKRVWEEKARDAAGEAGQAVPKPASLQATLPQSPP
ncbi:hypothetical protein DFJ74DRAFT_712779 [Hyaloraphidium curvatum]|nr:hypothetical protein DFJ74DRAFT_712779 [Hyaloraphidium curvatum]